MGVLATKQGDRLHPSQAQRHEARFTTGSGFSAAVTSQDFTAFLASLAPTAGRNGTAVASQESTDIDTEGWLTTTTAERNVILIDEATGAPPTVGGEEVRGVLTFAASVFTITYATFSTFPVTLPSATYTFYFPYRFSFEKVPADAAILLQEVVTQDMAGSLLFSTDELLPIVTLNTIPDVAIAPKPGTSFYLAVNGAWYHNLAGSPVVSFSGVNITWDEVEAGFDIDPGDDVVALYVI